MKSKIILALALLLILTSCSPQFTSPPESKESSIYQTTDVKNCRITAPKVDVKSGAGETFSTITTLEKGVVVPVIGKVDKWYVVRLDDNRVGCIDSTLTEPVVLEGDNAREPQIIQDYPAPENTTPDPAPKPNPAADSVSTELSGMEKRMVELVNMEREKNNLSTLQVDSELTRAARMKSQDMVDNDYFSHNSPTYGSPFDMMRAQGIEYLIAAENLALNQTVDRAHERLMDSSGHRKNILNPKFTHIGIGVKSKGRGTYIFTQLFIGKPK